MENTAFFKTRGVSANDAPCLNENVNGLQVCEARACLKEATKTIEVKVGHLGTISLSCCNDCIAKFRDEQ